MNKTFNELQTELNKAKAEKMNHEIGSYAYNIWSRKVKRLEKALKGT